MRGYIFVMSMLVIHVGSVFCVYPRKYLVEKEILFWCNEYPYGIIYSDGNYYTCTSKHEDRDESRIKATKMKGIKVRIGIIPDKKNYDYDCAGYFDGDDLKLKPSFSYYILNLLREILGFEAKFVAAETWGSYNEKQRNWTGLVGLAREELIDLGLCHTTVTEERHDVVDFLLSTLISTRSLVYNAAKLPLSKDVFVLTFSPMLWFCFFSAIVLLVICFRFSTWAHSRLRPDHEPWSWIEVMMWANAAICQQSYSRHPKGSSCRTTFLIGYLITYLLYTGFAAGVTSLLAVQSHDIHLSLKDVVLMKLNLVVQSDSTHLEFLQTSPDPYAQSLYSNLYEMLERNRVDSLEELYSKTEAENFVGLGTTVALQDYLKRNIPNKFDDYTIAHILHSLHQKSFLLPKNSPYKEVFNYWLLRLMETGLLDFGMKKHIKIEEVYSCQHPGWSSAGIGNVLSAMMILGGGWFFSVAILLAEIAWKRRSGGNDWEIISRRDVYSQLMRKKLEKSDALEIAPSESFSSKRAGISPGCSLQDFVYNERRVQRTKLPGKSSGTFNFPCPRSQQRVPSPATMEESDANILSGGEIPFEIPPYTVGQVLFQSLHSGASNDNVLIIEGESGRSVTCSEYLLLSIKIAAALKELDFESGDRVVLAGKNGIEICVAAAASLFAGGTISPIDPFMKAFEFQQMLKIIEPKVIFCDADIVRVMSEAAGNLENDVTLVILVGEPDEEFAVTRFEDFMKKEVDFKSFRPVPTRNNSESIAILACSSGTTGLPKAVMLSDRSIIFQLLSLKQIGMAINQEKSIWLHLSHFFWITGIILFLGCTCALETRVLVRNLTPLNILQAIEKYKPRISFMPPAHLDLMLDSPDFENYDVTSMRLISVGGAALQKSTYKKIIEKWPGPPSVIQGYGCTEVSGILTRMAPNQDIASVGRLIPGTKIKVLKEDGQAGGPREVGELCVKSESIMNGYAKNEEATRNAIDEDGWLHTGDTGYYNNELVYVSGRIKELIKYKGMQIAPAELEELIHSIPGVSDVGIAGIKIDNYTYHPMAMVVKGEDSEVTEEDIVKCVNENLSDYKHLRGGICFVDEIPRTPTGKIKRKDLQTLADILYMGD